MHSLSRRQFISVAALGGAGLLLQSCGGSTATPASSGTTAPTGASPAPSTAAKPGSSAAATKPGSFNGTITEAQNGEAKFNNPVLIVDTDGEWHTDQMFDRTVNLDAATLKPVPGLAESWEVSPDGLSYRFKLHQGVKWHDGQPFNADDVKFTVASILAPDYTGPFRSDWQNLKGGVDGVTVSDPNTINFSLSAPDATFLAIAMSNLRPIPKHLLDGKKMTPDLPFNLAPIGTGVYKFVEWKKGASFTMEANPDYWGTKAAAVKRIVQRVFPDQQALVLALESGDVDYSINVPPAELDRLSRLPNMNVVSAAPQQYDSIHLNHRNPLLAKLNVRRAISMAFDKAKFGKENTGGFLKAAKGIIGWGSWAYDANVKEPGFDMAQAKQLAGDAGKGAAPLVISTNSGNNLREETATILQAQLKQLGIESKVELGEFGALRGKVEQGQFDIAVLGFNCGYPDPDRLALAFQTKGGANFTGYSNKAVDDLFAQARSTIDPEKRKTLYAEIQRHVIDDVPVIPVYDYPNLMAINKKFQGIVPSSRGNRWNVASWTV